MTSEQVSSATLYEQVCVSYHAVDDFRTKLLGLLPIATGAGVFSLLNGKADLIGSNEDAAAAPALAAIGSFGFAFTLGLFAYELYGIKRCHYLIQLGRRLESEAKHTGQFRGRPPRLAGFIAEPFASSLIYPGSLSAWLYLAIVLTNPVVAIAAAVAVMVLGCAATTWRVRRMVANQRVDDSVLGLIPADTRVDIDKLALSAGMTGGCLRRIVRRLQERGELTSAGRRVSLSRPRT